VPCGLDLGTCRRVDIAAVLNLEPNPRSPGDFEGKCPECGHGGFALSQPTLTKMRNMWSCNCKRCGTRGCLAKVVRLAMIRQGVPAACLGTYIGTEKTEISQEEARLMAQTIDDILAAPGLKPADMRIALAEARGRKVPTDYHEFIPFALSIGVGRSQAYEAGKRECEYPPQTGGDGSNSSSTTEARSVVKSPASEARIRPETGLSGSAASGNRTDSSLVPLQRRPETGQRTLDDKSNRRPAA
jgi:hypothetical protein